MDRIKKVGIVFFGVMAVFFLAAHLSPLFAQTVTDAPKDWAPLVAKISMGIALSLGLAGSALGLSIAFQALLGGGQEN